MLRINLLVAGLAVTLAFASNPLHAADALPLTELAKPGRVLMLRHALAPGVGDPAHFELRDCTTQRNLDAAGRAQAVELGKRLVKAGIARAKVYSSQWCRCLDTARRLDLGPVAELTVLNSFFRRAEAREPQTAALREFLAKLPTEGPLVVLVTHQVVISALTGRGAVSGGGVILALNGTREPRVLGDIEVN
ncbi:MAG: histidine phosphatase family protein [Betaproteobacteria bacterium]|jgi:phosphohistidine phosphatase SixA|nr:histidine phosphatase family protein [Betaproteobacteria bacterium]